MSNEAIGINILFRLQFSCASLGFQHSLSVSGTESTWFEIMCCLSVPVFVRINHFTLNMLPV